MFRIERRVELHFDRLAWHRNPEGRHRSVPPRKHLDDVRLVIDEAVDGSG